MLRRISVGRLGRRAAAAAVFAAVLIAVATVVLSAGSTPSRSSNGAGNSAGVTTVERRNLVQTDTESGTLSYSNPQTVYNRLSGTITWLPGVGQLIKPGQPLYKVDGEPVILMEGTMPAYRDLSPADSGGHDITELNRNLVALGFNPDGIAVDDLWQPGTTAGAQLLQESLGETPTGTLSLGQIVFLPGDQLVTSVEATLGGTGGSGSGGANASDPRSPASSEYVSFEQDSPSAASEGSALAPAGRRADSGAVSHAGSVKRVRLPPARVI